MKTFCCTVCEIETLFEDEHAVIPSPTEDEVDGYIYGEGDDPRHIDT